MHNYLTKIGARLAHKISTLGIATTARVYSHPGEEAIRICFDTRHGNGWPLILLVAEDMSCRIFDLCNDRCWGTLPPTGDGLFHVEDVFCRLRPLLESFGLVPYQSLAA
jgi:hypothetical protein